MRRRTVNIFSLSFLDCICCGLGALILLFVIVNAKSAAQRDAAAAQLKGQAAELEAELLKAKKAYFRIKDDLEQSQTTLVGMRAQARSLEQILDRRKKELANQSDDTTAAQTQIEKLQTRLKALAAQVERIRSENRQLEEQGRQLRPFPGTGDRQYLTDLKVGGKRILILVDASASMLDETIVGVVRRRNQPAQQQRRAPKWRQAVSTVDWLTAQLPATSLFQVYVFNDTVRPLMAGTEGTWLKAAEVDRVEQALAQLRRTVPQNGTSLIKALEAIKRMTPAPDNLFLITDSLPTMGASPTSRSRVSGKQRMKLFSQAAKKLPSRLPVNVILLPMEGDPLAAIAFWSLAVGSRGALVCPSQDWP